MPIQLSSVTSVDDKWANKHNRPVDLDLCLLFDLVLSLSSHTVKSAGKDAICVAPSKVNKMITV